MTAAQDFSSIALQIKNPARNSGRAQITSFNFLNSRTTTDSSSPVKERGGARSLIFDNEEDEFLRAIELISAQ